MREKKGVCPFCEKQFVPIIHNQKFCSLDCGRYFRKKKNRKNLSLKRHCLFCGENFETKYNQKKFCSPQCQRKNKLPQAKPDKVCSCGEIIPPTSNNKETCKDCMARIRRSHNIEQKIKDRIYSDAQINVTPCPWESGQVKQLPFGGIM